MAISTDLKSASAVALLVEFKWGDPVQTARYAVWASDVTFSSLTFTAMPAMEISFSKQDGGVQDAPATIVMPNVLPVSNMRTTHPTVRVTIWELEPGSDSTAYVLHRGIISMCEYNHNGNANTVQLKIASRKAALAVALSVRIGRYCPWTLGKRPCQYDREARKESATVAGVLGNRVTLSGLVTVNDPALWKFGGIRHDGLEIGIHSQTAGTQVLYTVRPIPESWVGMLVDVLPGCDKTFVRCDALGQTENYGGMGIKIPDRDVRYED